MRTNGFWSQKNKKRKACRAVLPRRKLQLTIEALEPRTVPTAGLFLQGTAYVDVNNDHQLDNHDTYLSGATINLYQGSGSSAVFLASTTTNANGRYLFQDNQPAGLVLTPGTYSLTETPPAGYANNSAQVYQQINSASVSGTAITVTLNNPTNLRVNFDSNAFFARSAWDFLQENFHYTGAGVITGSPVITMTTTNPLAIGEGVTVSDGTTTLTSTIATLTANSITLNASWTGATGNAATVDTDTVQPLNVAIGVTNGSNVVTMPDTSALTINESVRITDGSITLNSTITGLTNNTSITLANNWTGPTENSATIATPITETAGQFPVTVTPPGGAAFLTLCWDLSHFLTDRVNNFQVVPTPGTVTPPNAGQIAYLYNHYGTVDITNASADNAALAQATATPPALPTGTTAEAVGLQVAMWELEYGANLTALQVLELSVAIGGNFDTNSADVATELANINTWATFYKNDAAGKSETATFLQVANGTGSSGLGGSGTGSQGMICTGSGDFGNVPSGPSISTTPTSTPGSAGITIGGTKFQDLTGNGFSADDTGLAGVTINLYQESNSTSGLQVGSGGDTLFASTITSSTGAYSFTNVPPGTYYAQEAVPSGDVQTGGGPNGSAGNTYYTIVATSGNRYSGYNFDDFVTSTCAPANVTYTVTAPGCYPQTYTTLSGNTVPGATVTVNFSVPAGMSETLTLVSYYAPSASWSDSNAYQQLIYQQATGTFAPGGPYSLTVKIPNTFYQIDFVCGPAINQLEPNQNGNIYGPDSAEILYHAENRYISSDNGGSTMPSTLNTMNPNPPTPVATPAPTGTLLNDSATLSAGINPTGSITFYLFAPGVTPNSNTNPTNFVYSQSVTVTGNGTYNTNPGYLPTMAGTFQWVAIYSGDAHNSGVSSPFGSEPWSVGPATTTIVTTPTPSTAQQGTVVVLKDAATLSGGSNPGGTITFTLYGPSNNLVDTETVTVAGNGSYTTPHGYSLPTNAPTGTYQWDASYSGDNGNASSTDNNDPREQVTVTPPPTPPLTICGTKYKDLTGNGFSCDDPGLGGVTINLYQGSIGSTPYRTTTTAADGSYSFTNLAPGTYYVVEVVPSGYVQTGGGPNGTAGATYYTIVGVAGKTYGGNNFDDFLVPTCQPTNVCFTIYNNYCQATTVSDLRGNTQQGNTVCVTFTVPAGMSDQLTLVSYTAPGSSFNQSTAYQQNIFDEATGIFKPGKYTICVTIPNCYYQIDFVCGPAIDQLAPPTYNGNPYGPDSGNVLYTPQGRLLSADNGGTQACSTKQVSYGDYAASSFWSTYNGQNLIKSCNGSSTSTSLAQWLVTHYPNLYGQGSSTCLVNSNGSYFTNNQLAQAYNGCSWGSQQVLSACLSIYCTNGNLAGVNCAWMAYHCGLNASAFGTGGVNFNVGSYGSSFGESNYCAVPVQTLLSDLNANTSCGSAPSSGSCSVFAGINNVGHVTNALSTPSGNGFSPAQVRTAYGINNIALDGTGQTIAVVDAYDDPAIFQSVDAFDAPFGVTATGSSLYAQYGPASSFLTVLNQAGQTSPLPATDPSGAGNANWEAETALDVEWIHAMAPGAQIILVEASSQALADLMASVGTAAQQPGVSVVSMSWGYREGSTVLQQDEAMYDSVLTTPAGHQGVTFVASTGDYGTADPEYPAFSPNVVAVGGTSLTLNGDNSYSGETGWGYSDSALGGTFIGTGGGVSQFESEPAWQTWVQSSGHRTTPDVSLVADPNTGVFIADSYNLDPNNPWEVAGGTSLAAPSWAALIALANQGRVAAGQGTFDASGLSAQQALYNLPSSDFNDVTSGTNGDFSAAGGYDVVTGLGTPQANLLVPDLVAYAGANLHEGAAPATYLSGYQPSDPAALIEAEGVANMFSVFAFETAAGLGLGRQALYTSTAPLAHTSVASPTLSTPNFQLSFRLDYGSFLIGSQQVANSTPSFANRQALERGAASTVVSLPGLPGDSPVSLFLGSSSGNAASTFARGGFGEMDSLADNLDEGMLLSLSETNAPADRAVGSYSQHRAVDGLFASLNAQGADSQLSTSEAQAGHSDSSAQWEDGTWFVLEDLQD